MRVLVLEYQEVMCSLGISGDGFYGYARTDEYGLSVARNKMLKEILRDYTGYVECPGKGSATGL